MTVAKALLCHPLVASQWTWLAVFMTQNHAVQRDGFVHHFLRFADFCSKFGQISMFETSNIIFEMILFFISV